MKFDLPMRAHPNLEQYPRHDIDTAHKFANELYKEMGGMIKAVVLFGSTARNHTTEKSDIDVLVVIDDLTLSLTPEVLDAYRLIINKIVGKVSTRLHVTTLRFTAFWEYMRNGDPLGINILRDGVALIDAGFFEPMQVLLKKGKIRPSQESIWTYYTRAPNTLKNSKLHIQQATVDLYWAVIDAAHAALMKHGSLPPTPSHVAELLERDLVRKGLLEAKYVKTMSHFYQLMKKIIHRELDDLTGLEYDKNYALANEFVERMRVFIDKDHKL